MSTTIDAVLASTDPGMAFRELSFADKLAFLNAHGEPADPRADVDTASLVRRFSHLASVQTTNLTLQGSRGPLAARAYHAPGREQPTHGLVWAHGGAFLGGHLDMPESNWVALELAAAGVPVLAIDYTKCRGVEHFPVPSDDVERAWEFALRHTRDLFDIAPENLFLGGASAGATLTASAVQRRVPRGGRLPAGLILVYPAVHPDPMNPDAIPTQASPLHELSMNYAGTPENLRNPNAFPGLGDGRGFPPTLIVACEHDAFLPSAERFADTLRSAGVDAEYRTEMNADHGHINDPSSVAARQTIKTMRTWMQHRIV